MKKPDLTSLRGRSGSSDQSARVCPFRKNRRGLASSARQISPHTSISSVTVVVNHDIEPSSASCFFRRWACGKVFWRFAWGFDRSPYTNANLVTEVTRPQYTHIRPSPAVLICGCSSSNDHSDAIAPSHPLPLNPSPRKRGRESFPALGSHCRPFPAPVHQPDKRLDIIRLGGPLGDTIDAHHTTAAALMNNLPTFSCLPQFNRLHHAAT